MAMLQPGTQNHTGRVSRCLPTAGECKGGGGMGRRSEPCSRLHQCPQPATVPPVPVLLWLPPGRPNGTQELF